MELIDWTSTFIDNLNSFKRDLENKENNSTEINCMYKVRGLVKYIVEPDLNQEVFRRLEGQVVLVCLNKKENLVFVINNWGHFIKNPKLKIIFANPIINQQWSLIPYTHHSISDPKSLKLGLKSLFESVPEY
jgi:hypothetical protein